MSMRRRMVAAMTMLVALAVPGVASAGGWATVGLDPPPRDLRAGQPWAVELTILQHGRTPLDWVAPKVSIRPAGGGRERAFAATHTGRPGVYAAQVVVPAAGVWTYAVDDGFTARHTFGELRVADSATPDDWAATLPAGDSASPWSWSAGLAAAGVGLGVALLVGRWGRTARAALPG